MKRKRNAAEEEARTSDVQAKRKHKAAAGETVAADGECLSDLELMKVLRSSVVSGQRKIELAFKYVELHRETTERAAIPIRQFITFLAESVQTIIISSSKSQQADGNPALDSRTWMVLQWCIANHSVHISPGIVRGIEYVLSTLALPPDDHRVILMEALTGVLELLSSTYGRTFRPQLLDWVSLVVASIRMVLKDATTTGLQKLGKHQVQLLRATNFIAEGFTGFLGSHSNAKASFQVTVEKLLDPLLSFVGIVTTEGTMVDPEVQNLQGTICRALENALFHTSYVEGFSDVCTVFRVPEDPRSEGSELGSNHRLLFDKLKKLREAKNFDAVAVLPELLTLFVRSFKAHRAAANEDAFGVRGEGGHDLKGKQLSDDQRLFLVFAEMASPLMKDLIDRVRGLSLSESESDSSECIRLMSTLNGLFRVAKYERLYIPTRDPSQEHLKFLKQFYGVLVNCSKVPWREGPLKASGLREVISGISLVLDLEHRAVEEEVGTVWDILISAAALETSEIGGKQLEIVVACGCKMINVLIELRNLSSLRLLFSSVRSVDSPIRRSEPTTHGLFCDQAFLGAIKNAMKVLPEGQAAEVVKMISGDASETLGLVSGSSSSRLIVSTLSEVYACMLETLQITSANARQVSVHIDEFVSSVLKEALSTLLDELSRIAAKRPKRRKALSTQLKSFYLLRLFLVYRTLHRQCLSLMPPRQADKSAHELSSDSIDMDWTEPELKTGIFSWIDRPMTTVAELLEGIKVLEEKAEGVYSCLDYVADRLVLHRLSDLRRYVYSVQFHEAMACSMEDRSADMELVVLEGSDKEPLHALFVRFRSEAKALASFLLDGGAVVDKSIEKWDGVVATLTEGMLASARWLTLSTNVDLWSGYANKKRFKSFVTRLLDTSHRSVFCGTVSRQVLGTTTLYESRMIESVFLPAFYKALEKTLHLRIDCRDLNESMKVKFSNEDAVVSLEEVQKAIDLFLLSRSFPREMQSTMQHLFCACFVERFVLAQLKLSTGSRIKLLELLVACRSSLQFSSIPSDQQNGASIRNLLHWLYTSIDEAAMFFGNDQGHDFQRMLIKSTQCFIKMNTQVMLSRCSTNLLNDSSGENGADCSEAADAVLNFFRERVRASKKKRMQDQVVQVLGAVTSTSGILWSMAAAMEGLDSRCQEDRSRSLRWSTSLPGSWLGFMKEAELLLVSMISQKFALAGTDARSIVDVFSGSEGLGFREDDEDEDEEEDEPEEGSIDNEEGDDDSHEVFENEEQEQALADDEACSLTTLSAPQHEALSNVISGSSRDQAEVLGELFMGLAAIVRVRSLYFSRNATKPVRIKQAEAPAAVTVLGLLHGLFKEAARYISTRTPGLGLSDLSWLFGPLKCMESMGYLLPSLKPALAFGDFSKLVAVHIELLGAVLGSEASSPEDMKLERLKNAVRDSFGGLLRYVPKDHLLRAFRTIHRSLDVSGAGGVASAVECLAVTLDAVSGPWRLKLLANFSPYFVSSLMKILQGADVFVTSKKHTVNFRCLEILTRLASRDVIFPMKPSHVGLALHSPGQLLRPLYQFKLSGKTMNFDGDSVAKFYVASCKLLYSMLKHRTRHCGRSIPLLAESLRVLLYCLEAASESGISCWDVTMAAQCGQWLRRVYEELGAHKETLARYCNHVISDYLAVLSGVGPLACGLSREVDKEIRPGIYALIEACSPIDIQRLHMALGDGPLRTNFNMVRQDFEKSFKYTGKV